MAFLLKYYPNITKYKKSESMSFPSHACGEIDAIKIIIMCH